MTSARDLTIRLADLLRQERAVLAEFLVALADFDRERRWLELGHASLFYFLHRELGLSKGAAFYRKTAAELIQRFPEVIEPLRDGRLCLTSIVELAKVLTQENRVEVLPRFFCRSKAEAKAVSAELRPAEAPSRREVITAVRAPVAAAPSLTLQVGAEAPGRRDERAVHPDEPLVRNQPGAVEPDAPLLGAPAPRAPSDVAEPLTAELSRLHVTVSRRFIDKLEAARAALSHSHPGASADEILEAGLDLVLERHAKRVGQVKNPRRDPPPSRTDRVPAHVKRAVWKRDGGRCQWTLAGGGICGSTHRVQFDHVVARGRGGRATVENLRLLCAVHNDLAARQTYGDGWMDRFSRRGAARTRDGAAAGDGP